jgi:hypothetical protein
LVKHIKHFELDINVNSIFFGMILCQNFTVRPSKITVICDSIHGRMPLYFKLGMTIWENYINWEWPFVNNKWWHLFYPYLWCIPWNFKFHFDWYEVVFMLVIAFYVQSGQVKDTFFFSQGPVVLYYTWD